MKKSHYVNNLFSRMNGFSKIGLSLSRRKKEFNIYQLMVQARHLEIILLSCNLYKITREYF